MTVEEFWEFGNQPANTRKALDLINGEIVEWPRPYRKHGVVCTRIGSALVEYVEQAQSGYATSGNAGVILARDPATVIGPDLALYADEGTEDPLTGWSLQPPTLAVEALSPDDNAEQLAAKVVAYLANGVQAVWIVDYQSKLVVVHRPAYPALVFREDDSLTHDELPHFACRVADFFRLPGERPHSSA